MVYDIALVSFSRTSGSIEMIVTGPPGKTVQNLELSSITNVSIVQVSSFSNTGSIRDYPY